MKPAVPARPTMSFDVFDTVVTRTFAHPRDVFVRLGELLRERGLVTLPPMDFAQRRWDAELAAHRASPAFATTLAEIYARLRVTLGWGETESAAAQAIELELEGRHLRAVPVMRDALAAARSEAGRVVFLSDMYLPGARLREWLDRLGTSQPGDVLLLSGEAGGGKSSGTLFRAARQTLGADFAHWRHTGDHAGADVDAPRKLGIQATSFTAVHLTPRERAARGTDGEFAPVWRSLLAGAMRLARLQRSLASDRDQVLWELGSGVAGPLFYGFVRWTLAEARRRGVRRLYFLARDGQIFRQIARDLEAGRREPIECRYLHGSRLVFTGPAELENPAALRELVAPHGHFHSLRQALASVGLEHLELPPPFASRSPDENLTVAQREQFADWLLAAGQRPALREAITRRADIARRYLAAEDVRAGEPIALVDAGWTGTVQRNLERIIGAPGAPAALTGFYLAMRPPADRPCAGEALGYTDAFAPLPFAREPAHRVLLELFAQADHGQVTGFTERDGRWEPRLNDPGPVDFGVVRLLHEAVGAFIAQARETRPDERTSPAEFARAAIALYRDFHDAPAAREARVFGFLPHADQWLEQRHATLCAEFSLVGLLRALVDHRRRPPHWWVNGQAALGHDLLLGTFRTLKQLRWRLGGRRA